MPRPVSFVRLPEGRLWHVEGPRYATVCGRAVPVTYSGDGRVCETLDGHVPAGAWVCARCHGDLAAQLRVVAAAVGADPRHQASAQDPLPWWMSPRSWSAEAIWGELLAETGGAPFHAEAYASWILREHLNPWGFGPSWPDRMRELVAA